MSQLKAVIQQFKGVQLQQPLTLLHIALAPRQILGVPGIHQIHFQAILLQHLKHRHPIHARALHGHAPHAFVDQPVRHRAEIGRETSEAPHRL
jgi:hypothetical protein